jgi:hypothetical protein
MKDFSELMVAVLAIFPEATVEQDRYGQIVIHTNLTEDGKGGFAPFQVLEEYGD